MGISAAKYAAPQDADEFYRNDSEYVQGLVRQQLGASGNSQDAEDIAADIMEKLLTARNAEGHNALEQYNPKFTSQNTGQYVTWRAFLSGKVVLYVRGKREQVTKRAKREPLQCDAPAGEDGTPWVELFGPAHWDDYAVLDDDQFVARMRDCLAVLPPYEGPVSLLAVFDEICRREDASLSGLGLTKGQSREAREHLRDAVRAAAASPPPGTFTVEGVELSAAEVREAVERLKAGKGNHVHAALRNHRLQREAPKGWYHSFSAAERKLCPDCVTEQGTHRLPAGHVKRAVIHRLERMLAEAGCLPGEPDEEEPAREELLEAELWHIKGLDAGQVDEILAAVRKVCS